MDQSTDCFVSGALAVVLYISRFVGAAPLNFIKTRTGWRISLSPGFSVYGYIFITLTIVAIIGIQFLKTSDDDTDGRITISGTVLVVDIFLALMISGTIVYGAPGQMKSLIACLNYVQKINYELNVYVWPRNSDKKKMLLIFVLVGAIIGLACCRFIVIILIEDSPKLLISYVCHYIYYLIIQLKQLSFAMLAMHVMYSFRALNNRLRVLLHAMTDLKKIPVHNNLFSHDTIHVKQKYDKSFNNAVNPITVSEKSGADGTESPSLLLENIRRLSLAYSSLCDVVHEIDSCNGPAMLVFLGLFLLHLVASLFVLVNDILSDTTSTSNEMHVFVIIVQFIWCLYHSINLIMVIEPCHLTHLEIEVTRELVSHFMPHRQSVYDPLVVELDLFYRSVVLNQASYSPMGVTTLTRPLVATIFASVTTYLVIVIQL